eukprot:827470-Amorphochlora_amoeboformis.AAC.2
MPAMGSCDNLHLLRRFGPEGTICYPTPDSNDICTSRSHKGIYWLLPVSGPLLMRVGGKGRERKVMMPIVPFEV